MPKPYPQPQIFTCPEWGAEPAKNTPFQLTKPKKWLLHHTADQNTKPYANQVKELQYAFSVARRIQQAHFAEGWSDTGQQFTISRGAYILEGRHGSIAAVNAGLHVVGAECEGYNLESGGTEHEGTFDTYPMPKEMWNASVRLHAWIVDRDVLQSGDIDGHRDHIATDCPGVWFYGKLGEFRKAVHDELVRWRTANP